MSRSPSRNPTAVDTPVQRIFAGAFGALLGLSLLKFGNPGLMGEQISRPTNLYEWILTAWPLGIGQVLLGFLALIGLLVFQQRPQVPRWLLLLPLPWLGWQFVAAMDTLDGAKTTITLIHYTSNVVCFYLGLFCLSPIHGLKWFWGGLWTGFLFVLLSGWQQHFGGLDATREYFFTEVYPNLDGKVPEALFKRMSSNRIFATLFYPNTLAGVVLLLTSVCIGSLGWIFHEGSARRIATLLTIVLAMGCLFWSGSKAGWLLMIALALVAMMRLRFPTVLKVGIMISLLAMGLAGFWWKYSGYLERGAQSAVARFDYWEAAVKIFRANLLTGTGPGTFGNAYAEVKRPESEMAQVTHNDYLEQACNSGIPGFLFFTVFIGAVVIHTGRRVWTLDSGPRFWIWLGILGIALQSLVEFGWHIPAISWPMMTLGGWLVGVLPNDLDIPTRQNLTSAEHEGARSQRPKSEPPRPTGTRGLWSHDPCGH